MTEDENARAFVNKLAHESQTGPAWHALKLIDELAHLKSSMPCGHSNQYLYPPDTKPGEAFCSLCALQHIGEQVGIINQRQAWRKEHGLP